MNDWYKIKAKGTEARIDIYGYIVSEKFFDEDVSPKSFLQELGKIEASTINVHINSPGGEVASGIAIYNALRTHPARIITRVDAEAASMASILVMAGDDRHMAGNAWLMVHNPWGAVRGDAKTIRKYAETLDLTADILASIYAERSGGDKDKFLQSMDEETWYNAKHALDVGLVDSVYDELPIAACRIKPGRYRNTPSHLLMQVGKKAMSKKTPDKAKKVKAPNVVAASSETTPTVDVEVIETKAVQTAMAIEAKRRGEIRKLFGALRHNDSDVAELYEQAMEDPTMTIEAVNAAFVAIVAKRDADRSKEASFEPTSAGRVETVADSRDKFRAGVQASLMQRCRLKIDPQANQGNEYRGLSLVEIARASLLNSGIPANSMNKMQMVGMAMTHADGDFPLILEDIANKALIERWNAAPTTYQFWTVPGSLSDFKPASRISLEASPYLQMVLPGIEYRHATVGEFGEYIQLATYGRLFSINRQAIINDDTSAFSTLPGDMAEAARRTVNLLVYNTLISNPVMGDGTALFDAAHNNVVTAGAPSTPAISEMRTAMAVQESIGAAKAGTANDGQQEVPLNIPLRYIVVPVQLRDDADSVLASQFYVDGTDTDPNRRNPVQNAASVVSDPLLDKQTNSFYWYGAADRRTIEVAFLDGRDAPYLESQQGWTVDGVSYKVRIDAGVKALDWRGLVRNPYTGV